MDWDNDIDFDYREDSRSGDPDTDSIKLYHAHRLLWSRPLPCGKDWQMSVRRANGRLLLLDNEKINLSSDRMFPHFDGVYGCRIGSRLPETAILEWKRAVRTLGGHIVFPAHRRHGLTINQARGTHPKIKDRFDLTLECVRRFYAEQESPLSAVLARYRDFFDLFVDFGGYVRFFLLQDCVDDCFNIQFSLPFDGFSRPALPQTDEEFRCYAAQTMRLVRMRNERIRQLCCQKTC